jgi:hypothetical protein
MLTSTQYHCNSQQRRELVRRLGDEPGPPRLNGIDYLEVSEVQTTLEVHCIHPLASLPQVRIDGGVRIQGVRVTSVRQHSARVLAVDVDRSGDFSLYTLRLLDAADQTPPFDPRLSQVEFSFKVNCPSDFDCRSEVSAAPEAPAEPDLDYLAKDYGSFRRLMVDRLSLAMRGWKERTPADLQVLLVELLASVGDHLSYYQDAVATEAYLGTARQRISMRRHARLLDYSVLEGCNARTWLVIEAEKGQTGGIELPTGTRALSRGRASGHLVEPRDFATLRATEQPEVFETMHPMRLYAAHNLIEFYTWSDEECCLPQGATRATLRDVLDENHRRTLALKDGDALLFETLDGDRATRHVVRLLTAPVEGIDPLTGRHVLEIEWHPADALPFTLPVTGESGAVARGNLVLADHGDTLEPEELLLRRNHAYSTALLAKAPLTFAAPWAAEDSANAALCWPADSARPSIELRGRAGPAWSVRYDLLASDSADAHFVVEMDANGRAQLRFGDGVRGLEPTEPLQAKYRVGNGSAGNVGAESLERLVWANGGVASVRNPLAATGGTEPESIEHVRQFAPNAFRRQERAVTPADYAAAAERSPGVQKAASSMRWTGSWNTVFVTVDRTAGQSVDAAFQRDLEAELERYRMAGHDLTVRSPVFVSLDVSALICVKPGYFRSSVKAALLEALSAGNLTGGRRGFFHPDNFSFGQPVYLSQLYEVAMRVAGVASVNVTRFQRLGQPAGRELENGVLTTSNLEIVQLANDPNFPEKGRLALTLLGGL